nr:immunoglobulin heavy chain junction region [Macaca mulatta]MOX61346.1 immunoglobulin heavy chain junction region [Macaca mulatta]MOX61683.1 immunoglobulin heavy chain junction region [Macaca mulatta]MOX63539.1 immunoglobulin heavy chain junction region [Macaca mulatta]MOX64361.1 immunoglobulin heavy chain junction region [Macaca mulatta]
CARDLNTALSYNSLDVW